jgi:outer membrane immunogenic protein
LIVKGRTVTKTTIAVLFSSVAASSLMLASAAPAADLEPMVEEQAYDWSGIYLGAHVGYGSIDVGGVFDTAFDVDLDRFDNNGILGGGQVGWNWQLDSWVLGIEGDISAVGWDDDFRHDASDVFSFDTDFLATARARVGWAADNLLFYVTGGVAFLEGEFSFKETDISDSKDVSAIGGAVGGGFEWGFTENVSAKLEGLYLFFDDETSLANVEDGTPGNFIEVDDGFVVRAGINLRFNPP